MLLPDLAPSSAKRFPIFVQFVSPSSRVGREGYRAPPENILLIGITRSEKYVENGLLC